MFDTEEIKYGKIKTQMIFNEETKLLINPFIPSVTIQISIFFML